MTQEETLSQLKSELSILKEDLAEIHRRAGEYMEVLEAIQDRCDELIWLAERIQVKQ